MNAIVLLPLGGADRNAVRDLAEPLSRIFDARVDVREMTLDMGQFLDPARQQYHAGSLLSYLSSNAGTVVGAPRGRRRAPKILGVVAEDLFSSILTFVFGEADPRGRTALVSSHRLTPERYVLAPDPVLLATRFRKEAVHQLGHTYGLLHCGDQACVMHVSTDVASIDLKSDAFCRECAGLLHRPSGDRL